MNNTITPLNQILPIPPIRYQTGLTYFDDVLGGGLVEGSTLIISGSPGCGKSTMMVQVAYKLSERKLDFQNNLKVLYIAGEENKKQIKMRTERLAINSSNIFLDEDIQVEKVIVAIEETDPKIVVVDSLQMLYTDTLKTPPSSPTQMRFCLQTLCRLAKQKGITIIFVGHSTKSGYIAGLQSLQHTVDCVLWLSLNEDNTRTFQAKKNRFGSIEPTYTLYMNEFGLFEYPEEKIPFGQIKEINLTETEIHEIARKSGRGFLIHFSLAWLKEQAKKEADFNLAQNKTFTLTSHHINSILQKHPLMSLIVKPNLEYLKTSQTG